MTSTTRLLSAAIATLLFAALPAPRAAQASTALQRCTSADGSEIFTDKPCAAFGAQSAPIPAPMMTRLARTFERDDGTVDASTPLPGTASAPVGRRSAASGCARTPRALEMDLRGSLALGDINRIAESYHWTGLGDSDAKRILARLEDMAGEPVRDMHYFDAQVGGGAFGNLYADASGAAPATGNAGTLQVQLGDGSVRVVDLSVQRYAGCYFVRF